MNQACFSSSWPLCGHISVKAVFRLQLLCLLKVRAPREWIGSCLAVWLWASMFVYFSFGKTALSGRYLLSVGKKGILDIVGTTDNCLIYQGDLFVAVLFIRFSVFTKFCIFYVQLGNPKPLASVDLDCFYSSLGEVTCDKRFSVQKSTLVCNQKKKKKN